MKRNRVMVTLAVVGSIVLAFFFLPLPVSRVREVGMVQISEGHKEFVHPHAPGILTEVYVHDGELVGRGSDIARFRNPQFEFERQQIEKERDAAAQQASALRKRLSEVSGGDTAGRNKIEGDLREARNAESRSVAMLKKQEELIERGEVLRAPRAGIVMGVPKKEDMYKTWDLSEGNPLCSIGDPKKLRMVVPIGAADYLEIRKNLDKALAARPDGFVEVSILPKNRSDHEFKGRITRLPNTDEKNVPIQLTSRGGGNVATKPGGDPNVNQPLIQIYLVHVEIDEPDHTLINGTLATAKIHLEWRSAAWWTWRSIASALDIGLW